MDLEWPEYPKLHFLLTPVDRSTVAPDPFGLNPTEMQLDPISTGIRPPKRRLAAKGDRHDLH